MQLYNASVSSGLRNFTRFITDTDTTTFTNSDLDASLNMYYDLFVSEIIDAMDEWDFSAEIATTDLVANQQEYTFPTDILKIKRVEVTYDGSNWKKAEPMDVNEVGTATDATTVGGHFTQSEPYFDLMDTGMMLYPIPSSAVTGGLKIWYEKLAAQLSSDTDEPSIARPFHKGLCYGAAKDYFEKYIDVGSNSTKAQTAGNNLETIIQRAKVFYRKKNQDRQYVIGGYDPDYDYGTEY